MNSGLVISDLHLFSRCSNVNRYYRDIIGQAKDKKFLILNGDIIDFPWSVHDSKKTIDMAKTWLENVIKKLANCHIYYILGNHDCNEALVALLDDLSDRYPNFEYRLDYLVMKDKLFFHGDLLLKPRPHLERVKLATKVKTRGRVANMFYQAAVDSGLHDGISKIFHKKACAKYIVKTLHNYSYLKDVDHVYFGHTHNSFQDYECEGLVFHNTGSALKNSHLELIEV